jgi:hypothetical protein
LLLWEGVIFVAVTIEEVVKKYGDRMGLTPITAISAVDRLREGKVKSFVEQFNIFREYSQTPEKKAMLVEAIGTSEFPEWLNRQVQVTVFKNFESTPATWETYAEVKPSNLEVEQYFEMNSTGDFVEVGAERAKLSEVQFTKGSFNWIRNKLYGAKIEFSYKFMLFEGKYNEFFDQAALFGKMARRLQNAQVLAAFQAAANFGAQTGSATNAGSAALSIISLDLAELYFMNLKDLAGDAITFKPDTIVIPTALWATLKPIISPESTWNQAYVTSSDKSTKLVPMLNTYAGMYQPYIERGMTSTTQWYVFGSDFKPVVYQNVLPLIVYPHPFNSLPLGNTDNGMSLSWEAFIGFGAGVPAAHRRFIYRGNSS